MKSLGPQWNKSGARAKEINISLQKAFILINEKKRWAVRGYECVHYVYVPYHAITLGERDKQLELGLCDYLCILITNKNTKTEFLLLFVLLPLSPPSSSFSLPLPPLSSSSASLSDSFTSVMFFHFSFRFFCLSEYLCSKEPASSPPLLTSAVLWSCQF